MKRILISVAAILALCSAPAISQTTAFIKVNVVPMDTPWVLTDHTVIVEDGNIVALGGADEIAVPNGAEIIDGQGGY